MFTGRLRPLRYDPAVTNPKEVTAADFSEFYVEAIIDYTSTRFKRPPKAELDSLSSGWGTKLPRTVGNLGRI